MGEVNPAKTPTRKTQGTALVNQARKSREWCRSRLAMRACSRDVMGELVERLAAVFNRTKSNADGTTCRARVHLTQGDNGFAVILLVEGEQHAEAIRVIIGISAVV